jgi:CubicO group peptidase (beta-lactamase class C family)
VFKVAPTTLMLTAILNLTVIISTASAADDNAEKDLSNELALIASWLDGQRAYDRVPALSAAIVHDQKLLWSGASGYADIEGQEPATADTIYGICSISKLFTGIAVMQLRDQGKVHLDDPVSELLPWFNLEQVHWMDWDWETSWGLAFGIYRKGERTLTGHGGSCPGFNTRIYIDPISLYGVSVMANRNHVNVNGYARMMLDILEAGGAPEVEPENTGPNLADYVGSYDVRPWSGEDLVFRWKDGLAIVSLPNMEPLDDMVRLQHVEGDRFRTIRSDEQPGHEVIFTRSETGQVTHLTYHSNPQPKI